MGAWEVVDEVREGSAESVEAAEAGAAVAGAAVAAVGTAVVVAVGFAEETSEIDVVVEGGRHRHRQSRLQAADQGLHAIRQHQQRKRPANLMQPQRHAP
jgi:hypothetical protein